MKFYSHSKKEHAISLRREGKPIGLIERELDVPRSTLYGWIRNVPLTKIQKETLKESSRNALSQAQKKAAATHATNKEKRVEIINTKVREDLKKIEIRDPRFLEIALAFLYLGEGSKTYRGLGLGNSDPMILRFYLDALERLYGTNPESLHFALHLRADQNADEVKEFWSKEINVSIEQFKYILRDKRTEGKPTYPGYHGVCSIDGGGVDIQRRLMYLAKEFCKELETSAISSFGRALH